MCQKWTTTQSYLQLWRSDSVSVCLRLFLQSFHHLLGHLRNVRLTSQKYSSWNYKVFQYCFSTAQYIWTRCSKRRLVLGRSVVSHSRDDQGRARLVNQNGVHLASWLRVATGGFPSWFHSPHNELGKAPRTIVGLTKTLVNRTEWHCQRERTFLGCGWSEVYCVNLWIQKSDPVVIHNGEAHLNIVERRKETTWKLLKLPSRRMWRNSSGKGKVEVGVSHVLNLWQNLQDGHQLQGNPTVRTSQDRGFSWPILMIHNSLGSSLCSPYFTLVKQGFPNPFQFCSIILPTPRSNLCFARHLIHHCEVEGRLFAQCQLTGRWGHLVAQVVETQLTW